MECLGISRTAFFIDIVAVGFVADADDLCAQFVKHLGCDTVPRAVGGIDNQLQTPKVGMAGEGGFAKFDIAVVRTADAAGASETGGRLGFHFAVDFGFDFQLDFIGKFHAAFGEEFDAVVGIGVVRRGNHHAGGQAQRTGQISHAGCGQRSGLYHIHTRRRKTCHQSGFQHITGNTRVFAD